MPKEPSHPTCLSCKNKCKQPAWVTMMWCTKYDPKDPTSQVGVKTYDEKPKKTRTKKDKSSLSFYKNNPQLNEPIEKKKRTRRKKTTETPVVAEKPKRKRKSPSK